ncbi:MAG: hypothetical protein JXB47_19720 [Anaerolineae bacterium]|nr:hypothetical protein [Anaerolineae bacterium]
MHVNDDHLMPDDLLSQEIQAICKRYKTGPEAARAALLDAFRAQPGLIEAIHARHPAEDVTRLRAYKNAIKAARKQIYYQLRQYRREPPGDIDLAARLAAQIAAGEPDEAIRETGEKLLKTHTSTAERDSEAFYEALFELAGKPITRVIDVGCGLQPLAYPYDAASTRLYTAIDGDHAVIRTLEVFAPHLKSTEFAAIQADLARFRWDEAALSPADYDLALLLKLIPVVARQNRDILKCLAEVPAQRILITGNIEALTRYEHIRAREDKALRAFIELSGRRIAGEFETPGEFGYFLT